MRYFEVTPEAKAYPVMHACFTDGQAWNSEEVTKDFTEKLGFDPKIANMAIDVHNLYVRKLPAGLEKQFSKSSDHFDGYYKAHSNSALNKAYLVIIDKHNLKSTSTFDVVVALGHTNRGKVEYYSMDDKYYIAGDRKFHDKDEPPEGIIEMTAPTWHRLRADFLERQDDK